MRWDVRLASIVGVVVACGLIGCSSGEPAHENMAKVTLGMTLDVRAGRTGVGRIWGIAVVGATATGGRGGRLGNWR